MTGFAHLAEQQHFNPPQNEKYSTLTLADQAELKKRSTTSIQL